MQKVISIFSNATLSGINWGVENAEKTYPELQKLLDDGFKVKEVLSQNSTASQVAITLLLEK